MLNQYGTQEYQHKIVFLTTTQAYIPQLTLCCLCPKQTKTELPPGAYKLRPQNVLPSATKKQKSTNGDRRLKIHCLDLEINLNKSFITLDLIN